MKFPLNRYFPAYLLVLALGLALAACGSVASAERGATTGFTHETTAQTVEVRVDPGGRLAWDRATYTATAGDVTFVVSSPPGIAHNFSLTGGGIKAQSKAFGGGTTTNLTLNGLAAGTYTIACTIPGHSEGGMIATLIVR